MGTRMKTYHKTSTGPKKKMSHPIDHGWAWMVLCGGVMTYVFSAGILKSFGIIFVELLDVYKSSVAVTSLIMAIEYAVYSIVSLIALTIGLRYLTCRQLVMLGGFFSALGFLISSFAKNIYAFFFSYSIIFGIGHALLSSPSLYILGKYFKNRRGIANGILMSSASVGALVTAPLVRVLLDEYSLKGTLLILSAFLMNIIMAGSLMRPPEFFLPRKKQKAKKKSKNKDSSNGSTSVPLMEKEQSLDPFRPRSNTTDSTFSPLARKAMLTRMRSRTESEGVSPKSEMEMIHQEIKKASKVMKTESSKVQVSDSSFKPEGSLSRYFSNESLLSIALVERLPPDNQSLKTKSDSTNSLKQMFDRRIFRNYSFLLFLPTYCLASIGASIPIIYLPAFAEERNIGNQMAAVLIMIYGVCDALGRILCGLVSDKLHIAPKYVVLCCLLINCLVHFLTRFYFQTWALIVYVIICGTVGGGIYSLYGVILLEMVGLDGYSSALAVVTIAQGLVFASSNTIVGRLRDVTGTYVSGHLFVSACLLLAIVILTIESVFVTRRKKSTQETDKETDNGSSDDTNS